MLLAGAKRAENRGDIFGGFGGFSTLCARAMIAAVDCDADEPNASVVHKQGALGFFVSTRAVQHDHGGTTGGW